MRQHPVRALILVAVLSVLPWLTATTPVGAGSSAQVAERCFAQTGKCVSDKFLTQWETHGGLPINGYPLTDARMETLEGRSPLRISLHRGADYRRMAVRQLPPLQSL